MSVASEITRLQNAKADLKSSINAKNDSQHQIDDETIDEYADFVDAIQTGGGGADLSDYFTPTISGTDGTSGIIYMVKKIPDNTIVEGTSLKKAFFDCGLLTTIPFLDTSNVTDMSSMFSGCTNLTTIPLINTSNVTKTVSMFNGCSSLISIPLLDISNVATNQGTSMFSGCTNLTTVPLLNTSKMTNMNGMFTNCPSLTDISLDNILQMCINSAVTSQSRKTLAFLGLTSNNYPVSRIEALPHYQDFIDAGWTIGY